MRIGIVIMFLLLGFWVNTKAQIRVACVGNSITYGAGIEGRDSLAYPQKLNRLLGKGWHIKNFGNSGSTLLRNGNKPYWAQKEFRQAQIFNPDVVIILLGTNDSKSYNWDYHHEEFIPNYTELINLFQQLPAHPMVFLGLPIPVVEDRWDISKEVVEKDVTKKIKQLAKTHSLELINFYENLRNHPEMIPDKIHPNADGATMMAIEAAKVLLDHQTAIQRQ